MVILVWLIVPILGSLIVPRASVRFSPKYLMAITPVYYTLIVLGLATLRKESRALFWACVIALAGISLYSMGDYYLRQHDKLAQLPEVQERDPRLQHLAFNGFDLAQQVESGKAQLRRKDGDA